MAARWTTDSERTMLGYIVMAYVLMACIVMVCTIMIVMAYTTNGLLSLARVTGSEQTILASLPNSD